MIKKTRQGKLFIQTKRVELLEDASDGLTYFIPLPPFSKLVRELSTPLLEDFFQELRMELQERDRQEIEDNLA